MGVQIEAMDGGKLKVSGDLERLLHLPSRAVTDGFSFAFSDGTLSVATMISHPGDAIWRSLPRAAMVRIMRDNRHDRACVEWKIEWMTLACGTETLCPIEGKCPADDRQLMLDIDVKEAA